MTKKTSGSPGEVADKGIKALMKSGLPIYQRGTELVRLIQRADGRLSIWPVEWVWLAEQVSDVLNEEKLCRDTARIILARGEWLFPPLGQLLHAPTIDRYGGVIEDPGYDRESGLYLDIRDGEFPPIPRNPSVEDATAALKVIEDELLSGFPFEDEVSRSVALSAFLTALKRSTMMTAPMHVFDAPMPGCGKSLLAELVTIFATGEKPAAMTAAKKEDENEKRLDVALHYGDPVIVIDNCDHPLESDALSHMLTSERRQARILSKSDRYLLETNATFLLTGNNVVLHCALPRRAVVCRIDPRVDRPDAREFGFDPRERVTENRGRYVTAALTALRAYYVHGKPERMTPMGSFEDYSDIRGTLKMCGYADPAESRRKLDAVNLDQMEYEDVIACWRDEAGEGCFTVKELIAFPRLREALLTAAHKDSWDPRIIGIYLSHHRNRTFAGYQIVTRGNRRWQLVQVSPPTPLTT